MPLEVELKLTKKKPRDCLLLEEENGKAVGGKKYLYTDTGLANTFAIAMWVFYKDGEEPKPSIKLRIEGKDVPEGDGYE